MRNFITTCNRSISFKTNEHMISRGQFTAINPICDKWEIIWLFTTGCLSTRNKINFSEIISRTRRDYDHNQEMNRFDFAGVIGPCSCPSRNQFVQYSRLEQIDPNRRKVMLLLFFFWNSFLPFISIWHVTRSSTRLHRIHIAIKYTLPGTECKRFLLFFWYCCFLAIRHYTTVHTGGCQWHGGRCLFNRGALRRVQCPLQHPPPIFYSTSDRSCPCLLCGETRTF